MRRHRAAESRSGWLTEHSLTSGSGFAFATPVTGLVDGWRRAANPSAKIFRALPRSFHSRCRRKRTRGHPVADAAVPLATLTGWSRKAEIGPDQLFPLLGSYIPFAPTRAVRESAGDPRRSIEERYRGREQYLQQVRDTANALVKGRYLRADDVEAVVRRAEDQWNALAGQAMKTNVPALFSMRAALDSPTRSRAAAGRLFPPSAGLRRSAEALGEGGAWLTRRRSSRRWYLLTEPVWVVR